MTPITLQLIKKPAIYGMILLFSWLPLVKELPTGKWSESGSAETFWPVNWPVLGVEWAIIPHLKEEILGYLLIKENLDFFIVIATFKHIFELCWGLPNVVHILGWQSVTSWRRENYHTPYETAYSYGPNSFNISGVIRELELGETFKWSLPHNWLELGLCILHWFPSL